MKVKVAPQDFIVREQSALPIGRKPDRYLIFRLTKRQWDTFDLVDYLARRLGISKREIAYGGIKDRFGLTEQLVSIRRGARPGEHAQEPVSEKNFSLSFVGYSPRPISAKAIRGNQFAITLRHLEKRGLPQLLASAEAIQSWGIPNYYDEQRFGSARHGKGFLGKELLLGRRERALRLYFEPSRHDGRKVRALKTCVVQNWGDWERCLPLAFGEYRRILEYLRGHRRAFRKALAHIDRRFLAFMLNAYQSFLFNEILAAYLLQLQGQAGFPLLALPYSWGRLLFYERLPDPLFQKLRAAKLPVPGYDSVIRDEGIRRIAQAVLEREGLELKDLKVRQMSGLSVQGVERPAILLPEGFRLGPVQEDELFPGKAKLTMEFFLPRGSYATLILKRLGCRPSTSSAAKP